MVCVAYELCWSEIVDSILKVVGMNKMSPKMIAALSSIFTPLARLLLRQGIEFRPVFELLRCCYVKAAISEFAKDGAPASISKVASATGLSRRTARAAFNESIGVEPYHRVFDTHLSDVLTRWVSASEYLDETGKPKALTLVPGSGSFPCLIESVLGVSNYENSLHKLVSRGSAEVTSDNKVVMTKRELNTTTDLPRIIADLIGTAASTAEKSWLERGGASGFFNRTVHSTSIQHSKVHLARRASGEKIRQFSHEIDDYFAALGSSDCEPFFDQHGRELVSLGVCSYYFEIERIS
jgi:hypothetical protein